MKVIDLIRRLQEAVDHGLDPDAEVLAWDPDSEAWESVTGVARSTTEVLICTDLVY
jgi:hypothetical protein